MKEYNKMYYDEKHRKPTAYNPGDYVLIRDSVLKPVEDNKLKPRYKGLYLVSIVLNTKIVMLYRIYLVSM